MFVHAAPSDLILMDLMAVIPPGASETCFQLQAVDDEIVEDNELFMVMVEAVNPNDVINRTALVMITDNDGEVDQPLNFEDILGYYIMHYFTQVHTSDSMMIRIL